MSSEEENHIFTRDLVDVNESIIENYSNSDSPCDSGIDSSDCITTTVPATPDTKISPAKHIKTCETELESEPCKVDENEGGDLFLGSKAASVVVVNKNDSHASDSSIINSETKQNTDQNNDINIQNNNIQTAIPHIDKDVTSSEAIVNNNNANTVKTVMINLVNNSDCLNVMTSSNSLNEDITTTDNVNITKSTLSKSAENISMNNGKENTTSNFILKDSTANVLSQFSAQKSKVSATHKILPDTIPQTVDPKYSRLPKELLSQDIGSIVKNVHGIFSTVSGSLKSAYNITHRPIQKQAIKNTKPILNSKVMNDIFEDNIELSKIDNQSVNNEIEKCLEAKEVIIEVLQQNGHENPEDGGNHKKDVLKLQIESLERLLAEQRNENGLIKERLKQQEEEMLSKDQTCRELETKMDLMSKRVDHAEREKDAAVMRYASVECAAIEARKATDASKIAEKNALAEVELLNNKIKSAHGEKQRICQLYDDKCHELSNSERELAKVREDVKELEGRLKWTQSKLRMEMDAYKESAEKAEKLSQQVTELEATAADPTKVNRLESELKESQAALILCRHEIEELERRLNATTSQYEACVKERDSASSSLTLATAEIERLKEKTMRLEEEAAELASLRAQAALANTLTVELERERDRAEKAEEALSIERSRSETCLSREAAALQHAAALAAQHAAAAHATDAGERKAKAMSLENESLRERITSLEHDVQKLNSSLTEETDRRHKENRAMARKVAELTEELSETTKKLEWEKGENDVLKKKHATTVKEINRELQRSLKRCEQLEAKLPSTDDASTRTGSVTSLSSSESTSHEERQTDSQTNGLPDIQPDRQALIERIVALQRSMARRAERCEFLEEHSRQLTQELRAKSKLLRKLLCTLPAGAVAAVESDNSKKEIARIGGSAMGALWGGDTTAMTLELSLEMNKRLQAVLEDTLLKNITLKENMDTLGEEIARLKGQTNKSNVK